MNTVEEAGGPRGKQALQRSITWYLRQLSRLMRVLSDEELERLVPLLSERRFKPRQAERLLANIHADAPLEAMPLQSFVAALVRPA